MTSERADASHESFRDIYARAAGAIAGTRAMTATTTLLMREWHRLHGETCRLQDGFAMRAPSPTVESSLPRLGTSERARRVFMRELGSRVRERRLARGLLQVDLARAAGTSQAAISRLEQGSAVHMPAIHVLNIVRMLGLHDYDIHFPVETPGGGVSGSELLDRYTRAFDRMPRAARGFLVRVVEELVDDGWRTATPTTGPARRSQPDDSGTAVRLLGGPSRDPEKGNGQSSTK